MQLLCSPLKRKVLLTPNLGIWITYRSLKHQHQQPVPSRGLQSHRHTLTGQFHLFMVVDFVCLSTCKFCHHENSLFMCTATVKLCLLTKKQGTEL
jgi:hypothetical protein